MRTPDDVADIDSVLREYPWLDMSISEDNGVDLALEDSLSESYPFEVHLVLQDVLVVAARRCWHTNTSDADAASAAALIDLHWSQPRRLVALPFAGAQALVTGAFSSSSAAHPASRKTTSWYRRSRECRSRRRPARGHAPRPRPDTLRTRRLRRRALLRSSRNPTIWCRIG